MVQTAWSGWYKALQWWRLLKLCDTLNLRDRRKDLYTSILVLQTKEHLALEDSWCCFQKSCAQPTTLYIGDTEASENTKNEYLFQEQCKNPGKNITSVVVRLAPRFLLEILIIFSQNDLENNGFNVSCQMNEATHTHTPSTKQKAQFRVPWLSWGQYG